LELHDFYTSSDIRGEQMKDNQMDGACGWYGEGETGTILVGKREKKATWKTWA
jgi:hypothetical protein